MATTEIALGQKIKIFHQLRRSSEYRQDNKINEYGKTEFKEWCESPLKSPIEVIVIGLRTLSNGYNVWEKEYGNVYHHQISVSALLVVETLRSKPFYIHNILR